MCGLLVKCAALIVMIHGFRLLGRLAGPRWSGLALGLPSTTAVVLFLCGSERGRTAATAMAESSLLGLAAAVAVPLAFGQAVRLAWRLPAVLGAAVAGYTAVACTLGCLPACEFPTRLGIALTAIVSATRCARRLSCPEAQVAGAPLSAVQSMAARTAIPVTYVLALGIAERFAGPGWAGLVSTFPSMSLVVLVVTHLEAGPGESSRIAKVLPTGNLGTLAFLAAFHFVTTRHGVIGGTAAGYMAAISVVVIVQGKRRIAGLIRQGVDVARQIWETHIIPTSIAVRASSRQSLPAWQRPRPPGPRYIIRERPGHRGRFAPRVETLAW